MKRTVQMLCASRFGIKEDDGKETFIDVKEDILTKEDFSDIFSGWE